MHYLQCELSSVYAKHTTLTSRHLIFVIWQNFAIQKKKERVSLRIGKKNLGSHKTYEEAQQVGLFYSSAFFIRQMLSSLIQFYYLFCLFFLCFLAITVVPTFAGTLKKREGWTVTIDLSVPKLVKQTKLVCLCMFEALWSTKNVMVNLKSQLLGKHIRGQVTGKSVTKSTYFSFQFCKWTSFCTSLKAPVKLAIWNDTAQRTNNASNNP